MDSKIVDKVLDNYNHACRRLKLNGIDKNRGIRKGEAGLNNHIRWPFKGDFAATRELQQHTIDLSMVLTDVLFLPGHCTLRTGLYARWASFRAKKGG